MKPSRLAAVAALLAYPAFALAANTQGAGPKASRAIAAAPVTAGAPAIPTLAIPSASLGSTNLSIPGAAQLPGIAAPNAAAPSIAPAAQTALPAARLASQLPGSEGPTGPVKGTPKSASERLGDTARDMAPEIQAAGDSNNSDPRETGRRLQLMAEGGRRDDRSVDASPYARPGMSALASGFMRPMMPNPREAYAYARSFAVEEAKAKGLTEESVALGQVTGSLPATQERKLHYTFYVTDKAGARSAVYVDVSRDAPQPGVPYRAKVSRFDGVIDRQELFPGLSQDYYINRGVESDPELALTTARQALHLRGGVSFSLKLEREEKTGDIDAWYRFYDDRGSVVAVNARSGATRVEKDASPEKEFVRSVHVDIAKDLAASVAVAAVAHFLPAAGLLILGGAALIAFAFGKKRLAAIVAMGMMIYGWAWVMAGGLLTVGMAGSLQSKVPGPLDGGFAHLYADAYTAAQSAALRAKLPAPRFSEARMGANGWTFDFVAGDRLVMASPKQDGGFYAYAYGQVKGGTTLNLEPSSVALGTKINVRDAIAEAVKRFGVMAESVGVSVILVEEPGSGDKDLWYVGDTEEGYRVMINGRTGQIRPGRRGPTREVIERAVKSAAHYKGRPWSQTEFNMTVSGVENGLLEQGATVAQMKLFDKLLAAEPIKGGSFNPWSGD